MAKAAASRKVEKSLGGIGDGARKSERGINRSAAGTEKSLGGIGRAAKNTENTVGQASRQTETHFTRMGRGAGKAADLGKKAAGKLLVAFAALGVGQKAVEGFTNALNQASRGEQAVGGVGGAKRNKDHGLVAGSAAAVAGPGRQGTGLGQEP